MKNISVALFAVLTLSIIPIFTHPCQAETVEYHYDGLNRLTRVDYSAGPVVLYTYDPSGNRLARIVQPPLAGDVYRDLLVDLKDAVLSLQLCTGIPGSVSSVNDATGDSRIGIDEALYILRTLVD